MRRALTILLAGLLISTVSLLAFAEKDKGGMIGKKAALNKYLVVTEDDGIVVMAANRLWKYDKNLEFVKEVKIEMDFAEIIKKVTKNCPIYKKYKEMSKDTGIVDETLEKCKRSTKPKLVATEDGGVIVIAGNRLWKYDKNLDLRNELDIEMYIENLVGQIKQECPYRKKMVEESATTSEAKQGQEKSSKVSVQIIGFLDHAAVKKMIAEMDGVLNKYANSIAVEVIEAISEDGELFLKKKSLKEFKPKVDGYAIFIDEKYQFDINGEKVTLKGCPLMRDWETKDLDKIIQQKILEKKN